VDQTDRASLKALFSQFSSPFQLIIDDGYHHPVTGFPTVLEALRHLAVPGFIVVEDIEQEDVCLWQIFRWMFREHFRSRMVRMRHQHVCVLCRTDTICTAGWFEWLFN
jgi:hypothetical protein